MRTPRPTLLLFARRRILQILYRGPNGQKNGLRAFGSSAVTPPKVNRFGWNLEHREPNVGDWPWQILGASRAVATVWEGAEFFVCEVYNARFYRFPVGHILRHLNTTASIGVAMYTFGTEFLNFYHKGSFTIYYLSLVFCVS